MGTAKDNGRARVAIVPAMWQPFYEASGIPAAVRVGGTLYLSGHTGESDDGAFPPGAEEQIRGTFRNLGLTLTAAGASWADVVELTSYHVGLRGHFPAATEIATEFLVQPLPVWTAAGVTELYDAEALIEISCVAVVR